MERLCGRRAGARYQRTRCNTCARAGHACRANGEIPGRCLECGKRDIGGAECEQHHQRSGRQQRGGRCDAVLVISIDAAATGSGHGQNARRDIDAVRRSGQSARRPVDARSRVRTV
jgi:hypothetical protein